MEIFARTRARQYDELYLSASSTWLRDPEIQRLTMTPPFTDEQ
jgi:hypothetical protein